MKQWQLLEQIFTVETIMTPRITLLTWDQSQPLDDVWARADALQIDVIPVVANRRIIGLLQRGVEGTQALTHDWLITRDTSIPALIKAFVEQKKHIFLVFGGQEVVGLVSPADLNKLAARTYMYNLIAELEVTLVRHLEERFPTDEALLDCLQLSDEQLKDVEKRRRESQVDLHVIHTLYLSNFINAITKDEKLRRKFGFESRAKGEDYLNRLVGFRNSIMHPTRPTLSNTVGIEELQEYINRTVTILMRWGELVESVNQPAGEL